METGGGTEIVLVHGLWFGPWAMAPLARRLARGDVRVRRFGYRSTRAELRDHAVRLHEFAVRSHAHTLHFVGHSLGGLVILKMLSGFADLPPGRLVLLGSPLQGSAVVRKADRLPGSAALTGRIRDALESGYAGIPGGREAGMIAGSRSVGLGWMVGGTDGPGDGTVAVAETEAEGLTDHCVLPVTHTGMIFSAAVAEQAARFLQSGAFDHGAA